VLVKGVAMEVYTLSKSALAEDVIRKVYGLSRSALVEDATTEVHDFSKSALAEDARWLCNLNSMKVVSRIKSSDLGLIASRKRT
jgi:hypothetical protein